MPVPQPRPIITIFVYLPHVMYIWHLIYKVQTTQPQPIKTNPPRRLRRLHQQSTLWAHSPPQRGCWRWSCQSEWTGRRSGECCRLQPRSCKFRPGLRGTRPDHYVAPLKSHYPQMHKWVRPGAPGAESYLKKIVWPNAFRKCKKIFCPCMYRVATRLQSFFRKYRY